MRASPSPEVEREVENPVRALAALAACLPAVVATVLAAMAPVPATAATRDVSLSIDAAGPTQEGRISRDGNPSSCSGKAYPGISHPATSYAYTTFTFVPGENSCTSITRTSASCGTNAHLSLYHTSYDPANQSNNFLGDQGASADNTFSAEVTAGTPHVLVATNTSSVESCEITVELPEPPDTIIDSGPAGPHGSQDATFAFHGDPAADTAKVQCRIDADPFSDCTSPHTFSGLAEGPHTAEFRAEDAVGFQDQSPATRAFTVDLTAPDTRIDSGPAGMTIAVSSAAFAFHGEPSADTAKIQCKLDGGAFFDCSSPHTFSGLADGAHAVQFRAEDAAGNQDPTPAITSFTVGAADTGVEGATLRAKKKQRLGKRIKVKLRGGAAEAVRGVAKGKIVKPAKRKRNRKRFRLKKVKKSSVAGELKRYKLKPRRKRDVRKIRRFLRKGKTLRARLRLKLRDDAGNKVVLKRTVKLKAKRKRRR